jgi:predicted Zn-dependent peptidase
LGGETPDPEALSKRLLAEIPEAPLTGDDLARLKKRELGDYMTLFNHPDDLAYAVNALYFRGVSLFDVLTVLDSIELADIERRRQEHVLAGHHAVSVITPAGSASA